MDSAPLRELVRQEVGLPSFLRPAVEKANFQRPIPPAEEHQITRAYIRHTSPARFVFSTPVTIGRVFVDST